MISFGDLLATLYEQRVLVAVASILLVVGLAVVAWRAGWLAALRRRPRLSGGLVAVILVLGIPLGWYLASPLFLRTELVEPPLVAAAQPTPPPAAPSPSPVAPSSGAPAASSTPPPAAPTATALPTPAPLAAPRSGEFSGTDDFHFGRGTATLTETAPGEWSLRFDDFSVRNGPDLFVYLSSDPDGYVDGAVEVARLKATDGSFNVPLPPGTDPSSFESVLIWCKQFSTLFAVAPLGA